ncbi:MAG: hypothetical protein HOI88_03550 [Phycisphaerae bacterium]|nr:hypothetical protein [Phycisphaerae bacterium]
MKPFFTLTAITIASVSAQSDFVIEPVPSDAPAGLHVFSKHVDDGSGTVGVGDALFLVDAWGICA